MLNGILWILRTGAPWRDLPDEFGPWQTVYKRFNMWAKSAVWQDLLAQLAQDADIEAIMLDGSYIRAHQHSAGGKGGRDAQAIGHSRGGLTTKIHAAVDALGNPVRLKLTGGQVHDSVPAIEIISGLSAKYFIADKAYDVDRILEELNRREFVPVIPPKRNRRYQRPYDRHVYKERHLIECFFCKIKEFRRVATRYEKLEKTFLAMVTIASCLIWLR